MAKNERNTENVVRDQLRDLGYYSTEIDAQVEEQKSHIESVRRALKAASKSGGGGSGAPEFIVSAPSTADFIAVIECKADTKDHASGLIPNIIAGHELSEDDSDRSKRLKRYAADGVLHYAQALSRDFNVIAIAVSGEDEGSSITSSFLWTKNGTAPKKLTTKDGAVLDRLVPWADLIDHASFDPSVQKVRFDELMSFATDLHEFMRDHAKLTESEKPLLVSGTLIALRNNAFAASYGLHSPVALQKEWMRVIQDEIQAAELPQAKKTNMTQPYSSIAVHPELGKPTKSYPKGVLHELIDRLNEKVWPFISIYHDFDVVGQFYGEFLKYTGGDKKALGIVLTPRHITELFALIANVDPSSKVLDICAGTGGFLISSMHQMFRRTVAEAERYEIRKNGLIGVEQQPNMFALAASNMILRGDGKANLYQGSCFDAAITKAIKAHDCSVGMVNPPYSQSDSDLHELRFVKHMLECLKDGATAVAIVPVSCALGAHELRREILKDHTLEAVMTMPEELFYPVGVITCIMVFTANRPHGVEDRKTWFGYWKNDGFVKTKHKGRVDENHTWTQIRDSWVGMFRNREVHSGVSVMEKVTADDEWCAEAYIETDYKAITASDFEQSVREYAAFRIADRRASVDERTAELHGRSWSLFRVGNLFDVKKGKRLTKAQQEKRPGDVPFVGAIDSNNGVSGSVDAAIHEAGTLTVVYNGAGVAESFFQPVPFWASDDVNVLYPKFDMTPRIAMFFATIFRKEKYRFSYGRKWHAERMRESEIHLPVDGEGNPDWVFMESFVDSLPLSDQIDGE